MLAFLYWSLHFNGSFGLLDFLIAQQIHKLRRELVASQEKVATLTSQLSANVSCLLLFEDARTDFYPIRGNRLINKVKVSTVTLEGRTHLKPKFSAHSLIKCKTKLMSDNGIKRSNNNKKSMYIRKLQTIIMIINIASCLLLSFHM